MPSLKQGQVFVDIEKCVMFEHELRESSVSESEAESKSFALSSIVKVVVGKKGKVYSIHKDALVKESPFFDACLRSGMAEAQMNKVILPEDSCSAFNFVTDWVYSRQVKRLEDANDAMEAMEAFILADKYCMIRLQNALIEALKKYWADDFVHPDCVAWATNRFDDDDLNNKTCSLYRLIMDEFAWDVVNHPEAYQSNVDIELALEKLLQGFADRGTATELLWTLLSVKKGARVSPKKRRGCDYHVHENGAKCDV